MATVHRFVRCCLQLRRLDDFLDVLVRSHEDLLQVLERGLHRGKLLPSWDCAVVETKALVSDRAI